MYKIILNIGLLVFFLSIVYFSRLNVTIYEILFKSFIVFVVITIAANILALVFLKFVNNTSEAKSNKKLNLKTESKNV
jgi:hypothetical protein